MFIPIPLNGASTCCFPYIPAIPIPLCSPEFCIFCMLCKPGEWNYILFSELAFAWAPIGCIIFCWFIIPCTPPLFWTYGLPPNITYIRITKLILWSFTKNGSKNKRKNEKVQKIIQSFMIDYAKKEETNWWSWNGQKLFFGHKNIPFRSSFEWSCLIE